MYYTKKLKYETVNFKNNKLWLQSPRANIRRYITWGATQKSWRIYFQFVVPPLGGLS